MHRNTVTTGLALKIQASAGALGLNLWDQRGHCICISFRYTFYDSTAHIAFSLLLCNENQTIFGELYFGMCALGDWQTPESPFWQWWNPKCHPFCWGSKAFPMRECLPEARSLPDPWSSWWELQQTDWWHGGKPWGGKARWGGQSCASGEASLPTLDTGPILLGSAGKVNRTFSVFRGQKEGYKLDLSGGL